MDDYAKKKKRPGNEYNKSRNSSVSSSRNNFISEEHQNAIILLPKLPFGVHNTYNKVKNFKDAHFVKRSSPRNSLEALKAIKK